MQLKKPIAKLKKKEHSLGYAPKKKALKKKPISKYAAEKKAAIEGYKLRSVKITYSDGTIIKTSMSAHLTNKEIKDYFKIGKVFPIIKRGTEYLEKVKKVEIIK